MNKNYINFYKKNFMTRGVDLTGGIRGPRFPESWVSARIYPRFPSHYIFKYSSAEGENFEK